MHLRRVASACSVLLCLPLSAATYRWNGSVSSDWNTAANWTTGTGFTAGPAPTNGNFAPGHRLEVNNVAANPLVYTAAFGTTVYPNTTGGFPRALVIGNVTAGAMRIEGGVFSTVGSASPDIIGVGSTGTLTLTGGEYRSANLTFGNGAGGTSTLAIQGGTATVAAVTFNYTAAGTANINMDGGELAVGNVVRTLPTGTILARFNGGRYRATGNGAGLSGATVALRNGGVVFDTNGFNPAFASALAHTGNPADNAIDGGFIKEGAGTLTLAGANTFTGPVDLRAGSLTLVVPPVVPSLTAAAATNLRLTANGAATSTVSQVTLGGGTLTMDYGSFGGNTSGLVRATNLDLQGLVTVNLLGAGIPAGDLVVMTYTNRTGAGSFVAGTLPVGAAGTLEDTGNALVWRLSTGSVNSLTWSVGNGIWQTGGAANWNANTQVYQEYSSGFGDIVNFANGTSGTVTVGNEVKPMSMNVDTATAYTFSGSGFISGPAPLTKTGAGIATFVVPTAQQGPVAVNAGAVVLAANSSATGTVTVANGAAYALTGGVTTTNGQVAVIQGPGLLPANAYFTGSATQRGAITSVAGVNTFAGNIVFSGINARVGVQDGATLILSGNLTEGAAGTILNIRAGNTPGSDVVISGAGNAWTGSTDVYSGGGAAKLGRTNALPTGVPLRLGTSGIPGPSMFDLNGFDLTVAGLSQVTADENAFLENNGASTSTLTLNPVVTQTFLHTIRDGLAQVRVIKTGIATQVLAGVCAYTGDTTVDGGELSIGAAFLAEAADVHVAASARLHLNFSGSDLVDELRVNGQPMLAGTWGGTGSGADHVDPVHFRGPGRILVANGPAPTAYQAWAVANGLTGEVGSERGEGDDPDGDGLVNGAEFALNTNPRSAAGADRVRTALGPVGGQPEMLLTLPVRAGAVFAGAPVLESGAVDGVVYRLESGENLADWANGVEEVTGADALAAQAGLPTLDSGWTYRTFKAVSGSSVQVRGYIRWSTGGN